MEMVVPALARKNQAGIALELEITLVKLDAEMGSEQGLKYVTMMINSMKKDVNEIAQLLFQDGLVQGQPQMYALKHAEIT